MCGADHGAESEPDGRAIGGRVRIAIVCGGLIPKINSKRPVISENKGEIMPGLRVISGEAKGRKLRMVPGGGTRPINDRVKQALFNILGPDVEQSMFLDLFAGTGSVGIEALSRGAALAVFLDRDPRAIRTIEANLEHTGLSEKARVLRQDAFVYLARKNGQQFDYAYVAPPQFKEIWHKAILKMDRDAEVLNPDAWVVAQIHPNEYKELALDRLVEFDRRRYGSTELVFYELTGS
jgi:16S rRNA (guanine(966)-N(2))-methyltransferase RsmD